MINTNCLTKTYIWLSKVFIDERKLSIFSFLLSDLTSCISGIQTEFINTKNSKVWCIAAVSTNYGKRKLKYVIALKSVQKEKGIK